MTTNTKKLVTTALFAALTCVATMIIQIPTVTKGYINLGDCIVLLSGYMLGPVYGGIAAGIGAALADIISSYTIYAPATFVIKFLVALCAGSIFRFGSKNILKMIVAGIAGELIMILGYFAYECFITSGGAAGAAAGIVGNVIQAVAGIISSTILAVILGNIKEIRKFFNV